MHYLIPIYLLRPLLFITYLKKDGESLFCLFSIDFWAVGSFWAFLQLERRKSHFFHSRLQDEACQHEFWM